MNQLIPFRSLAASPALIAGEGAKLRFLEFFTANIRNRAKQRLSAIRRLFDWLVVGQVMLANPASSVRRTTPRPALRSSTIAGATR